MNSVLKFLIIAWFAIAAGLIASLFVGCAAPGTVTPVQVVSLAPSFNGSDLNSGLIAIVPGGRIIAPSERDGYNDMVAKHGSDPLFSPALKADAGIKPSGPNYFIDDEHWVDFGLMLKWKREGDPRHPAKTTLLQKAGI